MASVEGPLLSSGFPREYIRMQLIAKQVDQLEGQNGYANTTWLSLNVLPVKDWMGTFQRTTGVTNEIIGWPGEPCITGENQYYNARGFLQHYMTNNFPADLLKYVKRVVKYSRSVSWDFSIMLNDVATVDWLWIPSAREMGVTGFETVGPQYIDPSAPDLWARRIRKDYTYNNNGRVCTSLSFKPQY